MNIKPALIQGSHRTGTLSGLDAKTITEILGFEPNIADDPYKVVNSWGFTCDGMTFGIWDYKGSHHYGEFSTYGDHLTLKKIFGKMYDRDR